MMANSEIISENDVNLISYSPIAENPVTENKVMNIFPCSSAAQYKIVKSEKENHLFLPTSANIKTTENKMKALLSKLNTTEIAGDNEQIMVCPFYLHSKCDKGNLCEFAHEMTEILPENIMCEFHLRGECKYGNKCWYSHGRCESDASDKIKMRYCFRKEKIRKKERKNSQYPEELLNVVADMKKAYADMKRQSNKNPIISSTEKLPMDMCIHYDEGKCLLGNLCPCLHGHYCELCRKYCLHPNDSRQRQNHIEKCEKELETDMAYSFAIQSSIDKTCGICLEIVLEKEKPGQRKFGILENCNHIFCLSCIKQWRRRGRTCSILEPEPIIDETLMQSCPHCRLHSSFITPSNYWFYCEEEKAELLSNYKSAMKTKHCKYFKFGTAHCPFGGDCFYRHESTDGTLVELPPPTKTRRRRPYFVNDEIIDETIMWNYIEGNVDALQERLDHYVPFDTDEQLENLLI